MNELQRYDAIRYLKARGYKNLYVRGGCKVPLEDAPDRYLWCMYNRTRAAETINNTLFKDKVKV
jgi:hypothetical protein